MIVVSLDHVESATAEASEPEHALVHRRLVKAITVLGDYFFREIAWVCCAGGIGARCLNRLGPD